jgi:anaerobic dimethyl sulfoxide reductase subunit B (iron-sulfur subunit)
MPVGYYFDMNRCTGCRACQIACKDKNRLDVGTIYRNAKTYSVGKYPEVKGYSYSFSCNHCTNPACKSVCPTEAIYHADDGTVIIDAEICIGCGACLTACPYFIPQTLPSGIVGKCDGCFAIRKAGGQPACVAGCPNRALDFGERADMEKKHGEGVADIAILPSSGTTSPNTLINAKEVSKEANFEEVKW